MKGRSRSAGPVRGPSPPRPDDEPVERISGLRAGLAVFARRRDDIRSVGHARELRAEIASLCRWASAHGVPCREMSAPELDRFAESNQHEGLTLLARPRRWLPPRDLTQVLARGEGGQALALDRVRNPYNIGAMMRSAAYFGLRAVLLGAPAPHDGLAPTAVRVAEGGAEHLDLSRTTDLAQTLARLRESGVAIVGADSRPGRASSLPPARSRILVVGNEREGLGERVLAQCDALVHIAGAGAIESLNVSVAASILMSRMREK